MALAPACRAALAVSLLSQISVPSALLRASGQAILDSAGAGCHPSSALRVGSLWALRTEEPSVVTGAQSEPGPCKPSPALSLLVSSPEWVILRRLRQTWTWREWCSDTPPHCAPGLTGGVYFTASAVCAHTRAPCVWTHCACECCLLGPCARSRPRPVASPLNASVSSEARWVSPE